MPASNSVMVFIFMCRRGSEQLSSLFPFDKPYRWNLLAFSREEGFTGIAGVDFTKSTTFGFSVFSGDLGW